LSVWHPPFLYPISEKKASNRLVLAPLTNTQSHPDGTLSDTEIQWLSSRARAGFGTLLSSATYVSEEGRVWHGAMGACQKTHQQSLEKLAHEIHANKALILIQLSHGGLRANSDLTSQTPLSASHQLPGPACPKGAKEMSVFEIKRVQNAFVESALSCQQAGVDGIEIHAAHGYLLSQFIDKHWNRREDEWGQNIAGRAKIVLEIVKEIRKQVGKDFIIGLRLSVDNHGILKGTSWQEAVWIAGQLEKEIDYVHASLWDIYKKENHQFLIDCLKQSLPPQLPLMVAGGIQNITHLDWLESKKVNLAAIGKAAIAYEKWPLLVFEKDFTPKEPPYNSEHLRAQGISDSFLRYLQEMPRFFKN
jgi:2,4-dienoyl-CoA reductase-like NADH-dependent reductase (Old Yellow Enzyme family)